MLASASCKKNIHFVLFGLRYSLMASFIDSGTGLALAPVAAACCKLLRRSAPTSTLQKRIEMISEKFPRGRMIGFRKYDMEVAY